MRPSRLRSTLLPYTTLFRSGVDSFARTALSLRRIVPVVVPASTRPARAGTTTGTILRNRSEEHTSELQSLRHLVCRLLLEKKKTKESRNKRIHKEDMHTNDS